MVHHACRKLYGDNCFFADSSWKRYQRAHSGDTLIFNFGNTCCGGHGGYNSGCCGGGGNFWSNFGAGFGLGLANLCSGFLNGLMSPFSMMGSWMSPMMGCCMSPFSMMGSWMSPMMGGGMSWMSPFGMSDYSSTYIGSGNKSDKTAKTDAKPLGKPVEEGKPNNGNGDDKWKDTDLKDDNDKKRLMNADITPENYTELKNAGFTNIDDIINLKKAGFTKIDDIIKLKGVPASKAIEYKDKISEITADDIVTLHKIGVEKVDLTDYTTPQPTVGLGLPTEINKANLDELKTIAENYNIPVACGHNAKNTIDYWVAGKIDDIEAGTDGKISFTINCKDVGLAGGKYKFTQKDANSNTYIETPDQNQSINPGWTINHDTVEFTFEQGKDYMETTGKVATRN